MSLSSPSPEEEKGVNLGEHGREARAPTEGRNAGEGLRAQDETQVPSQLPRAGEGAPSQQERSRGLGEPSFHISAAELSCFVLLVPS